MSRATGGRGRCGGGGGRPSPRGGGLGRTDPTTVEEGTQSPRAGNASGGTTKPSTANPASSTATPSTATAQVVEGSHVTVAAAGPVT